MTILAFILTILMALYLFLYSFLIIKQKQQTNIIPFIIIAYLFSGLSYLFIG
ncbi:hypothetical protein [Heyndrickxia ginsengihumi]|uniref:Uncharacterized protein n=1 Tax=Heyndrickxia ginsengihumi TaxID=363870 RepID=A0A6M0P8A1_9BACI|nr:hypothetical protein [Heyndrickxia ginsengihumi]MCM3024591.1 hypothetical protein [Heyndrickxia ginsengihumi]NEY20781.1 hypothetical protein [Heyndrickxia ginsengihumi]